MPKIRTTKPIRTSLHTLDTHLIVFEYQYDRIKDPDGMRFDILAYEVSIDDQTGEEVLNLIPEGGTNRIYRMDELAPLIAAAKQMTPQDDNPIAYFDALVGNGIKIVIDTSGTYWADQLTVADFE